MKVLGFFYGIYDRYYIAAWEITNSVRIMTARKPVQLRWNRRHITRQRYRTMMDFARERGAA